jgi:hypothetical protein
VPASGIGRQPVPCSAFVVFHHLDGLLLLDPLRVLHRSSSLGVRDVSSSTPLLSPSRVPALRSFAPCTQPDTRGWRTILAPGRCHLEVALQFTAGLASPSLVSLDLEALLRAQSLVPLGVATVTGSLLPWACPGLLLHAPGGCIESRARAKESASPARAGSAHQVRMNVKDRREAQPRCRTTSSRSPSPPRRWRGRSP